MKLPWPVVLLGAPPPPGAGIAEPAPGFPAQGEPSTFTLGFTEARFANALWTSFDFDLDGIDVGAGSRTVWVARQSGGLWKINAWNPKTPELVPFAQGVKRISASRPPGGVYPYPAYQYDDPWVVASDGSVWLNTLKSWVTVADGDTLDISAGHFSVYASYPAVPDMAYRVLTNGAVEMFFLTEAGSGWVLAPWYIWNVGSPPGAKTTVAVERLRTAPAWEAVWLVGTDDHVAELSEPSKDFGGLPDGIWDIGAGAGVVWVAAATQSPDPGARGNSIWRLDPEAPRPTGWHRVSPGWAVAVDADEDGNAWVLDSDGRLHVRGARMPGAYDNVRGMPKAGESWADYLELYAEAFVLKGALYAELVAQSRLAGAGATVNLASWDTYAALPILPIDSSLVDFKAVYRDSLKKLLEKDRGIELLYCMAPIFTGRDRVPSDLAKTATKVDANKKNYIDFTVLQAPYVAVLKELAAVPGFVERVHYLSLGNEVDQYLRQWDVGSEAWTSYFDFCSSVIQEMRALLPRTKFGVTWTFRGMQNYHPQWSELMKSCDAVFVNYYAVDPDPDSLQVLAPEQYASDFTKLIEIVDALGGGKPIVMQEVGMPTDATLGGSKLAQAKFIEFLLEKWDELGIRIRFLSWFALHDFLYDPKLKVSLVDPTNPDSPIQVDVSSFIDSTTGGPLQFWGLGNDFPGFFLGPYAPDGDKTKLPTHADNVYWLNQSTTPGTRAEKLARFLSSCGLLAADGQPKYLPGLKPPPGSKTPVSSAWDIFRSGLEKRRRQT